MAAILKRSIIIAGHKTSISLEDKFWSGLREIASTKATTLSAIVASIDKNRQFGNLSSCIRLFVLEYYQALSTSFGSGKNTSAEQTATVESAGLAQNNVAA